MSEMTVKPDYVANYQKPKNTEIKHIGHSWYLYERSNKYDPSIKRSRKVSGKCLGRITENGLVASRHRSGDSPSTVPVLNDVVEVGAVNYFYQRSGEIRTRLQKYFPDSWQRIYTIALLRTIYDVRFRRLGLHYENSILSYLYPNLMFTPPAIRDFLNDLGRQRNEISDFMKESLNTAGDRYLLFDGHRLLSASGTMNNADLGYDSKRRFRPQINLVYLYTLGEGTGYPAYYKVFNGSTPDITAYTDLLKEVNLSGSDGIVTAITDKGFASSDSFELLESSGLKYIEPLKRGNHFVKGGVPDSPRNYDDFFSYNGRSIQAKKFDHTQEGFIIYLYLDMDLYNDELADLTTRTEKHNNTIEGKRQSEEKRRSKNKGKLSDEELSKLLPVKMKDTLNEHQEMGTITIKTNRLDLNSEQVYVVWKQRQAIEQYFKTYNDTMDCEASYMRSNTAEEAWLFLNHLSTTMGVQAIEDISALGESKNISLKDLIQTLKKINAYQIGETWSCVPVKKAVATLGKKLGVDLTTFDLPLPGGTNG